MLNTERPHRLYAPDDTGLLGGAAREPDDTRRATRDDIRPLPRRSSLPSPGSIAATARPLPGASGAVTAATARSLGRSGRDREQLGASARVGRLDSTPWVDVDGKHDRPAYEPSRTGNTALERFVKEQRALRDQPRPPPPRRGVPLATNRRGTMAGGWTGPGEGFRRLQTVPVRPALQREADARPRNADADAATRVGPRRRARTTRSPSARQSGDESGDGRTRSASSPSLASTTTLDRPAALSATVAGASWVRRSPETTGARPRPTHHRAASDMVGSHRPMIGVRTASAVATTTAPVAVAAVGVASPQAQAVRAEQRSQDRSTAISTELSDQLDARLAELEKSFQELSTAIDKAGGTKQLQSRLAALAGVGGAAAAARTTTKAPKSPAKGGLDADLEAIVRAAMRDAGTPSGVVSDAAIARAIGTSGKEKVNKKGKDGEEEDGKEAKDGKKKDGTSKGSTGADDDGTGRRAVEVAAASTAQAGIGAAEAQRALDASRVRLAQGNAALDAARAAAAPAKQTIGQRAKAGVASMAGLLRNPFARRATGPKPPDAKQAMVATSAQALLALQLAESRAQDAVFEQRKASSATTATTAAAATPSTTKPPSLGAVVVAPARPASAPPTRLRSMSAPLPRADQVGAVRARSASVPVQPTSGTAPVGAPIVIAPQPGFRPRSASAPLSPSDRAAPPRRSRSSSTPLARSDRDASARPRSTTTPSPSPASPALGAPVRPTSQTPATPTGRPTARARSASAGLPVATVAASAALPLAQRPLPQAPTAPDASTTAPPRPKTAAPSLPSTAAPPRPKTAAPALPTTVAPPRPKTAAPAVPASGPEAALQARIQQSRDEMAAAEETRRRELATATSAEQQALADRRAAEAAHDSRTTAARQAVAADNRRNKKLPKRLKQLVPFTKKATPSATSVAASAAVSMSNQSLLRQQLRASKAEDATAAIREKSVESQKQAKELEGKEARVAELLELIRKSAPQDGQKKPASPGAASTVVSPPETDPTLVKHAALLGSLQEKFAADDGTSVGSSSDPTMAQILAELRTLQARLDSGSGATTSSAPASRRATLGTVGLAVGGGLKLIGRNTRSSSAPPPPRSAGGVSAEDMANAIGAGGSDIDSMLMQTVTRTAAAAAVAGGGDDDADSNEDVSQSELVIDSEEIVRMVEQRVLEELDRRGLLNQGELW